ncbi:MAG: carbon-nitrogen family hydrolase [Chloroflexi bacterium]|mgnify:FL=1|nr:carbon-nitrogen family hydrolase [Chloroflexota bacterium]
MKIKVSLAQLQIQFGQPEQNLARAELMIQAAARQGSKVILLPELWTTGYDLAHSQQHADTNQKLQPILAALSSTHKIWIGGSLITRQDGKIFNTFFLHNPAGLEAACYSKLHLFGLMQEEQYFTPGAAPVSTPTPWGSTGLSICYDLRFADLFAAYALQGCPLVFLSAEWPVRRILHWDVLTQARAVEFQMFLTAVNAVGEIGNAVYGGRSVIVSPWGEVIARGSDRDEELVTAEIDLNEVERVRKHMPVLRDRRTDLFPDSL